MHRSTFVEYLTFLLEPRYSTVALSLLIALTLPVLFHILLYGSKSSSRTFSFVLMGTSGSGKTCLLSTVRTLCNPVSQVLTLCKLKYGQPLSTFMSRSPTSSEIRLEKSGSDPDHQSSGDSSSPLHDHCRVIDTPGHGKFRNDALASLTNLAKIKGVIYCVDAADSLNGGSGIQDAAAYLHDVLFKLQNHASSSSTSKVPGTVSVLIAVTKLDLFTALPLHGVVRALEIEISRVRDMRSRGLLDSAVSEGRSLDTDHGWLGDSDQPNFHFSQLANFNIEVTAIGGFCFGEDGPSVEAWQQWIQRTIR